MKQFKVTTVIARVLFLISKRTFTMRQKDVANSRKLTPLLVSLLLCCRSVPFAIAWSERVPYPLQHSRKMKNTPSVSLASIGTRQVVGQYVNGALPNAVIGNDVLISGNVAATSKYSSKSIDDDGYAVDMVNFTNPVCRIVAASDGKLPKDKQRFADIVRPPAILEKLDAIFHARAYEETRRFQYMQRSSFGHDTKEASTTISTAPFFDPEEEEQLIRTVRRCLEDAGFESLSKRDYDLCEALNAGYLLRLSILPDVGQADPRIYQEFYPERFYQNATFLDTNDDEILFEGRILVFWRGYACEMTRGRLLLPKLDYLQANLVQRSAAHIVKSIGKTERFVLIKLNQYLRIVQRSLRRWLSGLVTTIPVGGRLAKVAHYSTIMAWQNETTSKETTPTFRKEFDGNDLDYRPRRFFRLGRYGGSKIRFVGSPNPKDALNPFLICEIPEVANPPCPNAHNSYLHQIERSRSVARDKNRATQKTIKNDDLTCFYDGQSKNPPRSTQLLERVSISDVVDSFSHVGRARLLASFFSKSELIEPSFDEVVVVWRPLPDTMKDKKRSVVVPKIIYDLADIFDIEGLPPQSPEPVEKVRFPLEIRAFHRVPMANLLAILPKTKLVFRPADAFVFDFVSLVSFSLIVGSRRFDSPKLDSLALVSVLLWIIRTFFRYRNKLTSYDLLVKTFLTSKISHRNAGALKYVATEAGFQRAIRASLVYTWLVRRMASLRSTFVGSKPIDLKVVRAQLEREGETGVNDLLRSDEKLARIDMNAALSDLEALNLTNFSDDKKLLNRVVEPVDAVDVLQQTWTSLF